MNQNHLQSETTKQNVKPEPAAWAVPVFWAVGLLFFLALIFQGIFADIGYWIGVVWVGGSVIALLLGSIISFGILVVKRTAMVLCVLFVAFLILRPDIISWIYNKVFLNGIIAVLWLFMVLIMLSLIFFPLARLWQKVFPRHKTASKK